MTANLEPRTAEERSRHDAAFDVFRHERATPYEGIWLEHESPFETCGGCAWLREQREQAATDVRRELLAAHDDVCACPWDGTDSDCNFAGPSATEGAPRE